MASGLMGRQNLSWAHKMQADAAEILQILVRLDQANMSIDEVNQCGIRNVISSGFFYDHPQSNIVEQSFKLRQKWAELASDAIFARKLSETLAQTRLSDASTRFTCVRTTATTPCTV